MQTFLDMGGYADFIWPAYAIVAVVMATLVIASINDMKRQRRLLATLEAGEGKRKRAAARDGAPPASSGA